MLEDGNQKQLKHLGFNRILDPYSIGIEKAQNTLQVAENKGWLPTLDDFRTLEADARSVQELDVLEPEQFAAPVTAVLAAILALCAGPSTRFDCC